MFESPARLTSSLNEAVNDTGRMVCCGRGVLSATTGGCGGRVGAEIGRLRQPASTRPTRVEGTQAQEVAATLAHFGYSMQLVQGFLDRPRKQRPTLWSWMQKPRNAWVHYILAIHKGKEGDRKSTR